MNKLKKLATYMCIAAMTFVVITATSVPVSATESEWEWTVSDITIPEALRLGATVMAENDLYLIGGLNDNGITLNSVYVYQEGIWNTKSPLPNAVHSASAAYYDGKIYVFGGTATGGPRNTLQIYNITNDIWTSTTMPYSTFNISSTAVGDKIYLAGGRIGGSTTVTNYFYEFDTDSGAFKKMPDMLVAAGGPVDLIYYDNELYFFGGFVGNTSNVNIPIAACQKYNFVSNEWELIQSSPGIIAQSAIIQIGSDVYIIGGRIDNAVDEVYKYSLLTNTWTQVTPLPHPLYGASAIVIDNELHLLGFTSTSVYVYVPSTPALHVLLDINEQVQLSMSHNLPDNLSYIWTSTDSSVAEVDLNGVVTGINEGRCRIYAESSDGLFKDYIPVIVIENADDQRLALHLNSGEEKRLWFGDDPLAVLWSSMDTSIAVVDANGKVSGLNHGLCIVKAELDGVEQYIYVRVNS